MENKSSYGLKDTAKIGKMYSDLKVARQFLHTLKESYPKSTYKILKSYLKSSKNLPSNLEKYLSFKILQKEVEERIGSIEHLVK